MFTNLVALVALTVFDSQPLSESACTAERWLLSTVLLVVGSTLAAAVPLWRTRRTLRTTRRLLRSWVNGESEHTLSQINTRDSRVLDLVTLVRGGVQRAIVTHDAQVRQHSARALANLAAQVAHDVRSPLTALELVAERAQGLQEDTQVLLRMAASRIAAISEGLIERCKTLEDSNANAAHAPKPPPCTPLAPTLTQVLRSRPNPQRQAQVHTQINDSACNAFVGLAPESLGLLLSGLLAHALEVTPASGSVTLTAHAEAQQVRVSVQDQGTQLSPAAARSALQPGGALHNLQRLAQRGGGVLQVCAASGTGQEAVLCLPTQPPPPWYLTQLCLSPTQRVVIADDDPSIHAAWRSRLRKLPQLDLHHVHHPDGLRTWYGQHGDHNTMFLVDHDFRGHETQGLALIQELHLAAKSVLVTSHGDDVTLQARCAVLDLPLLNKNRVPSLPIQSV